MANFALRHNIYGYRQDIVHGLKFKLAFMKINDSSFNLAIAFAHTLKLLPRRDALLHLF